ncbi:MAG: DedA family protein [Bacteroidales bacterium]|nr:DedA family protein [Bacteroidales bacterium]MDD4602795.1 DedA family protein [Bacteroidales bacterium]
MEFLQSFLDIVLHIDVHIQTWVTDYQTWTYLILFIIVFMETGFVVTPFLPGDSLLFAAGAVAAMPNEPLNIFLLISLLFCAAFGGDNTNYFVGKFLGHKVYEKNYRFIKREYLDKTHAFYEKHGGKTIIIARFMPIIRTFAPFVAGIGTMTYLRFFSFSILGNILWVITFSLGGFFFGSIPVIKNNFSIVIVTIIFVSILPMIIALIQKNLPQRKKS